MGVHHHQSSSGYRTHKGLKMDIAVMEHRLSLGLPIGNIACDQESGVGFVFEVVVGREGGTGGGGANSIQGTPLLSHFQK